jgi:ketosteroid isomerase-like protein
MEPGELHELVAAAFNAGDVDALLDLYEDDAVLLRDDGSAAVGLDAIREAWTGLVGFGGNISLTTRYAIATGDTALLSNQWEFTLDDAVVASAITAEVARRRPDGSWRYLIDNPYGSPVS